MKRKHRISLYRIISVLLIILAFASVAAFIFNFAGTSVSKSMSDWGEFGSYASYITSIFNLVFFIILTDKASEFEKTTYKQQAIFQNTTFNQQMLAQKMELQTAFRKSHIDDIRYRLFDLNNLTRYDLSKKDEFNTFKRECEALIRIFEIYQMNRNPSLVGDCDYNRVNYELRTLLEQLNNANNSSLTEQARTKIWDNLNRVNRELISIEKELSDFTLTELEKAFQIQASADE